jgi:DNA-binding protein
MPKQNQRVIISKQVLQLEDLSDASKEDVERLPNTNIIKLRSGFMSRKLGQWIEKPVNDIADKLYVSSLQILAAGFDSIVINGMGINNVYTALHAVDKLLTKARFLDQIDMKRIRRITVVTVEQPKQDNPSEMEQVSYDSPLYGILITLAPVINKDQLKMLIDILSSGVATDDESATGDQE